MSLVYLIKVSVSYGRISVRITNVCIDFFLWTLSFQLDKENVLPFENKLPVFHRMLTNFPQNTRFMRLVADAPTTTLQRLKGITTGSLPTFIDIGSNFATAEINEDNIIDQVNWSFQKRKKCLR